MKEEIQVELINFATLERSLTSAELQYRIKAKNPSISISDYSLRDSITELVEETEDLICSHAKGFYIAKTEQEYLVGMAWIRDKIAPLVRRLKRMEYLHKKYFGDQINMEFPE